ncbi:hypothetical protein ACO0LB_14585 [Undibacterium sp. SXout7W]|uniref:hypothetical protein n=1 Tax=Undibacterium sp. SXout7W TaxID=3413049 RepID=UPI003BF0EBBB
MMEQLLIQLARRAHNDQIVAAHVLVSGIRLLVYPVNTGLIVCMGFGADLAYRVHPESLLQKRSVDMSRFGVWLPVLFLDGSFYVVRRIDGFNPASDVAVLTEEDLMIAQELIS